MKIKFKYVYIITLFSSLLLFGQTSKIKVRIINLQGLKGQISIGLFNNPESFPKKDEGRVGVYIEIKDSTVEHVFTDLENGTYAIAVYHDENSNGEFDRSFFGWPTEDYVFSNYAEGNFGPPSFEDASFELIDSVYIELEFR